MAEKNQIPKSKEFTGYILLSKDVKAKDKKEAESMMRSKAFDVHHRQEVKGFEVEGTMVEEE